MNLEETIIAVSAPRGSSVKTLIRMSGFNAFDIDSELCPLPKPRIMTKSLFSLGDDTLPVLVATFEAARSYTGQNTVEIQCPNNSHLIDMVIQKLIDVTGGRLAEAGEFTARAFFNGRLTLSEAEGVCATISASNDAELKGASLLREGALASRVEHVSTILKKTLGLVEAGIDFTDEEDVVAISKEDLRANIEACSCQISSLLDNNVSMTALHALPLVVIAGLPNAGKSTLFNALVGFERVVVNPEEGTTRDAISEQVYFGSRETILSDIAGIEHGTDAITEAAQNKTNRMMEQADLVIYCVAPHHPLPNEHSKYVIVHTKGDEADSHADAISVKEGAGLDALMKQVESQLGEQLNPNEQALALLHRHEQLLLSAKTSLEQAAADTQVPELVANSLRNALDAVGGITGQVTPDEVLGEVFSSFCVGK